MKILVYEWALHRIGGGQKVFAKIAECLSKDNDVTFLSLFRADLKEIGIWYNCDLSKVKSIYLFEKGNESILHTLYANRVSNLTKDYDLFINSNHEIVKPRTKSIIYFHFPELLFYRKPKNLKDSILLLGYVLVKLFYGNHAKDYDVKLCNSNYTKSYLNKMGINASVINPPIDT